MPKPAFGPDGSVVLFDDAVGNGQSETAAVTLGCKERVKNFYQIFFGNTFSAVGHGHMNFTVFRNIPGKDPHITTGGGGLDGVEYEIDEGLLNLALVHENTRQIGTPGPVPRTRP